MSVVVVVPAEPLVSLALAKKHLRVDGDDEDELIAQYVAAAADAIDAPTGWLNRAFGVQTLELRLDGFPPTGAAVQLSHPPVRELVSVTYADAAGVAQMVVGCRLQDGWLSPAAGAAWPTSPGGPGAVRIRYSAGYDLIPSSIVSAVLLVVGDLYAQREAVVIEGGVAAAVINPRANDLLERHRWWPSR